MSPSSTVSVIKPLQEKELTTVAIKRHSSKSRHQASQGTDEQPLRQVARTFITASGAPDMEETAHERNQSRENPSTSLPGSALSEKIGGQTFKKNAKKEERSARHGRAPLQDKTRDMAGLPGDLLLGLSENTCRKHVGLGEGKHHQRHRLDLIGLQLATRLTLLEHKGNHGKIFAQQLDSLILEGTIHPVERAHIDVEGVKRLTSSSRHHRPLISPLRHASNIVCTSIVPLAACTYSFHTSTFLNTASVEGPMLLPAVRPIAPEPSVLLGSITSVM